MATAKKETKKTNTLAIVGFILSFFFPLVGLILAIIGLGQIKKNPAQGGKGLAIAAIVISAFFMIMGLLVMIFIISMAGVLDPVRMMPPIY